MVISPYTKCTECESVVRKRATVRQKINLHQCKQADEINHGLDLRVGLNALLQASIKQSSVWPQ